MKKEIEGFEGYYVCDNGDIFSSISNKILSTFTDNTGYEQVILYKNGKRRYKRVHRIVAQAYVPNPLGLPMVNHKDTMKKHNSANNLEWCNNSYNTKHGYDNDCYVSRSKQPIIAISKNNNEQIPFNSIRECSRELNVNRKTLSNILNGTKMNNNYEYDFYYANQV